jgi:hypothetical protein
VHTWSFRFSSPDDNLRVLGNTRPTEDWREAGKYTYTNYKIAPDSYTVGVDYKAGQFLQYENITYLINTDFTASVWASDLSSYLITQGGEYGFLELEYVKDLIDPNDWSITLRQAIVLNLASKIVIPITGELERRSALLEEYYKLVIPHAQALDAMTGKPKQFFYSSFLRARI